MATLNRVFLLGNLTRDPEVRFVPSGSAVADIRLAVNRKYKTAGGDKRGPGAGAADHEARKGWLRNLSPFKREPPKNP